MNRICAWCRVSVGTTNGGSGPTSHALCRSCLGDLEQALVSKGLHIAASPESRAGPAFGGH